MGEGRRHVLLVGTDSETLDRVAPMLRRAEFEVHRVDPSEYVSEIIKTTPFELLMVAFPLSGISVEDLLKAVRDEASGSRSAGVLLLAGDETIDEAQTFVDRGANRAIGLDWVDSRLWRAVSDLLDVAPRVLLRAPVHAEVSLGEGSNRALLQSENVSSSGMLLRGCADIRVGSVLQFALLVPDQEGPIRGVAEVVRAADQCHGGVEGFGVRFVSFRDDDQERLASYISEQLGSSSLERSD